LGRRAFGWRADEKEKASLTLPGDPPSNDVSRTLLDIGELDSRLQEDVARYGNIKEFHVVLWRQESDADGCNWNARIERLKGTSLKTFSWWDVVPQMRKRFNLR
jgi:hypothetical protein